MHDTYKHLNLCTCMSTPKPYLIHMRATCACTPSPPPEMALMALRDWQDVNVQELMNPHPQPQVYLPHT